MTSEPEFLDVCTMTTLAVVPPTHYPVTGYSSCHLQLMRRCTGGQLEHSTLGFQELVHFE